jgi:tetratricopeptide (TPR) repeat protein
MSLRQGYRVRALALVRRNDEGDAAQAIEDFAHVLPGPEADLPDASTEAAPFAIVTPVETLVECYAARGWARYTLQDFPGGTTDYTEALHLRPDDVALLYGHAVGLANTGQLEAAYPEARRAAELDPAYLEAFYLAGQLALRLGRDYRGALGMFDRALVLEPQAGRVYGERARVQMCLGSFSQAAADLDRAITLLEEQHEPTAYLRFQRHLLCIRLRLATPDLSDFVASLADGWTKVLGTFLTGAIGEQELLAAATRGEQRDLSRQQGEAHYYAGMLRLLHGDQVAARDHLSRTVAAGQTRSVEFEQARAEIVRLDRNR